VYAVTAVLGLATVYQLTGYLDMIFNKNQSTPQ